MFNTKLNLKSFLILFFLCISINLYSQSTPSHLIITGKRNVVLSEGDKVKIFSHHNQPVTGHLKIINKDYISINSIKIRIEDISKIRIPNHANQVAGTIITVLGLGLGATGGVIIAATSNTVSQGSVGADLAFGLVNFFVKIIGIACLTTGTFITASGLLIASTGKKYRINPSSNQIKVSTTPLE